jgi:hypothetical protein
MRTPFPVRLAIAGLGRIAEYQLQALAAQAAFVLVAGCDPDAGREHVCPAGARYFGDLESLLGEVECDAVLVSTPTGSHWQCARVALEAGKHVLVEKPMCTRWEDVVGLYALAESQSVLLQGAFHMARGAEVDWCVAHLQQAEGAYGRLLRFDAHFQDALFVDGVLDARAPSVLGSWLDSGVNALSVLGRFLSVEMLSVSAASFTKEPGLEVLDVAGAAEFANGELTGRINRAVFCIWARNLAGSSRGDGVPAEQGGRCGAGGRMRERPGAASRSLCRGVGGFCRGSELGRVECGVGLGLTCNFICGAGGMIGNHLQRPPFSNPRGTRTLPVRVIFPCTGCTFLFDTPALCIDTTLV